MTYKFNSPGHINTRFNYFCDDCKKLDLVLEKEVLHTDKPNEEIKVYTLTCEHYDICKNIMHVLRYRFHDAKNEYLKSLVKEEEE